MRSKKELLEAFAQGYNIPSEYISELKQMIFLEVIIDRRDNDRLILQKLDRIVEEIKIKREVS